MGGAGGGVGGRGLGGDGAVARARGDGAMDASGLGLRGGRVRGAQPGDLQPVDARAGDGVLVGGWGSRRLDGTRAGAGARGLGGNGLVECAAVGGRDVPVGAGVAQDALGRRIAATAFAGASFAQTSRTVYDALGRATRTVQNYDATGLSNAHPADWVWSAANARWEDGAGNAVSHGGDNTKNLISDTAYHMRGLARM